MMRYRHIADLCVCGLVVDAYDLILGALSNYPEWNLGIVSQDPSFADRGVIVEEIIYSHLVSPADSLFRDIMAASLYSCSYSFNGKFR